MTTKMYLDWIEIRNYCDSITRKIKQSNFHPDYIVGIIRGGSIPAVILSHNLNIPCYMLRVDEKEIHDSDCGMAEDAFGYSGNQKNILIVDDFNNTGNQFKLIQQDWQSTCLPNDPLWNSIWHNNVRFASILNNKASEFFVDYSAHDFEKGDEWWVFPWERVKVTDEPFETIPGQSELSD